MPVSDVRCLVLASMLATIACVCAITAGLVPQNNSSIAPTLLTIAATCVGGIAGALTLPPPHRSNSNGPSTKPPANT